MKRRASILALILALASPAFAANVTVTDAFARATAPGAQAGVVYLVLQSDTGDKLIGASSSVATSAMLHQTAMTGMVMSMDMLSEIDLPAGQKVLLQPGKLHIMLEGLKQPLVRGMTFKLHLIFAKTPAQDILVPVASIAAAAPGD